MSEDQGHSDVDGILTLLDLCGICKNFYRLRSQKEKKRERKGGEKQEINREQSASTTGK